MDRSMVCAWLVAMWIAASGAASGAGALPIVSVNVVLRVPGRTFSPMLVSTMKNETEAIWEAYGVDIEWTDKLPAEIQFDTTFDTLPVRSNSSYRSPPLLGTTQVPRGAAPRVPIHIFVQETECILSRLSVAERVLAVGHPRLDDREIGRALGRVLAHEIGHVLLAAPFHSRSGLMRPYFTGGELLVRGRELYGLSAAEIARLEQRAYAMRHLAD